MFALPGLIYAALMHDEYVCEPLQGPRLRKPVSYGMLAIGTGAFVMALYAIADWQFGSGASVAALGWPGLVLFLVIAPILWFVGFHILRLRVVVTDTGITAHNVLGSRTARLTDIASIDVETTGEGSNVRGPYVNTRPRVHLHDGSSFALDAMKGQAPPWHRRHEELERLHHIRNILGVGGNDGALSPSRHS